MTTKVTAQEMRRRIRAKFEEIGPATTVPRHAVMFEVATDNVDDVALPAKHRRRRRIDAVAVGLWANTEHRVHGFEIKCSRADLLSELRQPDKAAPGVAACDTWSLVLASADLLEPDDAVPEGWGVLVAHGRGLRWVREPEVREGVRDARMVAALLQASLRSHGSCRRLVQVGLVPVERAVAAENEARDLRWQVRAARAARPRIVPDDRVTAEASCY